MKNVSFLPEDYQRQRQRRRTNLVCLGLFTVVMGGIVAAFAVTDRQRGEVRRQLEAVDADYQDAARRLEQLDELEQRKQQILHKANITSVLIERVPRSLILAEIINRMPSAVSLVEMRMETRAARQAPPIARSALDSAKALKEQGKSAPVEPQLPQIKPTEVTIQLTGLAYTDVQVAHFMTQLGRSPMFNDLNLSFSQETIVGRMTLRRFSVDMKLNQEVNLRGIELLRVARFGRQGENDESSEAPAVQRLSSHPIRTD